MNPNMLIILDNKLLSLYTMSKIRRFLRNRGYIEHNYNTFKARLGEPGEESNNTKIEICRMIKDFLSIGEKVEYIIFTDKDVFNVSKSGA